MSIIYQAVYEPRSVTKQILVQMNIEEVFIRGIITGITWTLFVVYLILIIKNTRYK